MKFPRACLVLSTCVLLQATSALQAQPREPNVAVPEAWREMYARGWPTDEERVGANPCPRPDRGIELHPRRRGARVAICVGRVKSRVVTGAWVRGLDEYGAALKPDAGARKLAEMELWLRRLAGKYRIEGEYAVRDGSSQLQGTAGCFGIGGGAGVSCVISAKWPVVKEGRKDKNLDNALDIAMQTMVLLFGIDPVASRIRVTLMDFRAIRMEGFLVDGAVIFDVKTDPELPVLGVVDLLLGSGVSSLVTYSWMTTRVALKPSSDVDVQFIVRPADFRSSSMKEFDLKMRRERPIEADNPRSASQDQ